jgi:TolB protein
MNADGSGQRRLTHLPAHNTSPAWLPDAKITFVSFHGPNDLEIYVINADGSGQRNLTRNAANDYLDGAHPWSPDGRKIVFGRPGAGSGAAGPQESKGDEFRRGFQSVPPIRDQPHSRRAS